MNLTGGNPITAHGLDEMSQRVNPWFRTPEIMKKAMAMGTPWDVPSREESVEVAPGAGRCHSGTDDRSVLRSCQRGALERHRESRGPGARL